MTEPHHQQPLCANSYTPTPWLTHICFTQISLTRNSKKNPVPYLRRTMKLALIENEVRLTLYLVKVSSLQDPCNKCFAVHIKI